MKALLYINAVHLPFKVKEHWQKVWESQVVGKIHVNSDSERLMTSTSTGLLTNPDADLTPAPAHKKNIMTPVL